MRFTILATFAELTVDLLRMRTYEGRAVAKARGKLRGKQPKLSPKQQTELRRTRGISEYSSNDLAALFSSGKATAYRTLQRNGGRYHVPHRRPVSSTTLPQATRSSSPHKPGGARSTHLTRSRSPAPEHGLSGAPSPNTRRTSNREVIGTSRDAPIHRSRLFLRRQPTPRRGRCAEATGSYLGWPD